MESFPCLYDLEPGQEAQVKQLLADRSMRRRLMDLGLTPGTKIKCLGKSPFCDPKTYLIRGAVIALRNSDSRQIVIEPDSMSENQERQNNTKGKIVALAGNPNVGKSTIFNVLTGMNQHTGNWPGKTVSISRGKCLTENHSCTLVDLPGTYSLMAHSQEEEVARDFLCFSKPDAVILVCDATCLERNMNLVLQTLEITSSVIICINLMDEAKRKQIHIDLEGLSRKLGVPVIGTNARKKESLTALIKILDDLLSGNALCHPTIPHYPSAIEQAIMMMEPLLAEKQSSIIKTEKAAPSGRLNERWLSLRLLYQDPVQRKHFVKMAGWNPLEDPEIARGILMTEEYLKKESISPESWDDNITASLISMSEKICKGIISYRRKGYHDLDRKIDRLITGKLTAFPLMFLMLCGLFWLTITGANYPSSLLSNSLLYLQTKLMGWFNYIHAPTWLSGLLIEGLYRELSWVISVMLPPMAIFFPLFTLLEDIGLLPRIAYNMDKPFQYCHACGKQCLSMAMGIGCNAAGVTGCRIIDSPRERLLAVLTNSFMPCNGRFPAIISIIIMFFSGSVHGWPSAARASIIMTCLFMLCILLTFFATWLLSCTLLKGMPSAFTLELPPYRRPQIRKVIVRSLFDRTLFVLGRAVCVAAPAGILLWLLANNSIEGETLLHAASAGLDPAARIMGLDGVILASFILGFPANEIVLPIMVTAYMSHASLISAGSLSEMHAIFLANGWTSSTAVCTLVFMLIHWPCSTTLLTIKKETGSLKWTALAAILPASCGIVLCVFLNLLMKFVRIS